MSWRTVVISSNAKLDYQMGYMVVRRMDTMKIHLSEIEILIVESTAVSLTAALLNELSKKKIKVIFCDEKRNPSSELVGYYGSHDTSTKIRTQITWKEEVKKAIWTEIVAEKIRKQAEHLEFWSLEEADMLYGYINELQFADTSNREGHAAKVYFNALLLSAFNRCITANGYLTQLGLFHDNMFNPFNLASDLMEPFRPIVDLKVKQMQPVKFEHDEKMEVLTILQNEVKINGRTEFVSNAIKIYCKSVFDAINNEDVSEIKFYRYEL